MTEHILSLSWEDILSFWSLCHLFVCSTIKKRAFFHLESLHTSVEGVANPNDPVQTMCALTLKYLGVQINLLRFQKWAWLSVQSAAFGRYCSVEASFWHSNSLKNPSFSFSLLLNSTLSSLDQGIALYIWLHHLSSFCTIEGQNGKLTICIGNFSCNSLCPYSVLLWI